MSTRKYESGYSKLQKKRRIESLTLSQKGALDKFFTSNKNNTSENIGECSLNKQVNNLLELDDNEILEQEEVNEVIQIDTQNHNEENQTVDLNDCIPKNIYDPSQWINIDTNLRDLLVEKGLIRINDIEFPKDEFSRHFSTTYYIQKLANGEKHERRWLVYSKDLDKVFCFCCKLFNSAFSTSKLANVGTRD